MIIKRYPKLILNKLQSLIEKILLTFLYFVGIGITSLIAKLVRKSFLNIKVNKSTWEKPSGSKKLESMY